jgi:hypothetical protein
MSRRFARNLFTLFSWLVAASMTGGRSAGAEAPQDARAAVPKDQGGPAPRLTWDDAAFAGLPPGARPELLTWERAYTLALVRLRAPRPAKGQAPAASLDPPALARQAERLGVADFERFRKDFFTTRRVPPDDGPTFVDPSGSLFDLLQRLQALENARKFVAGLEELKAAYQEANAGAPNPPRPTRLDGWLEKGRARFQNELRAYRDRLGQVKAELGLVQNASVVPDRTTLAGFRSVFEKVEEWFRNPDRDPADLRTIVARLPRLPDRVLGQIPLGVALGSDPKKANEGLQAAEQVLAANRGRGDLDSEVGPRVGGRIARLLELRASYGKESRQFLLAIQAKDEAFELIMTPAPPGVVVKVPDLIALHERALQSEDRLVALWASFQAERLALARDLRVLPARDWASFLAQIPGEPAPRPSAL